MAMPKDTPTAPSTRRPAPRPMSKLVERVRALWAGGARMLADLAPKGLYARALIIIIAPIVLLESVVAFIFMERHWNQVTRRLSDSTARNIGAVVDLFVSRAYVDDARLVDLAKSRFGLSLTIMEAGELPKGGQPKPFF